MDSQDRPYGTLSVEELERLFTIHADDRDVLQALKTELARRETERAHELARLVDGALAKQAISPAPGSPASVSNALPTSTAVPSKPETPFAPRQANLPAQPARPASQVAVQIPPLDLAAPARGYAKPGSDNEPSAIVANWIALEALEPKAYLKPEGLCDGDSSKIASLAGRGMPWERNPKVPDGYDIFYHIVLGAIDLDMASRRLEDAFGRDEERGFTPRSKAVIASLLVDQNGACVADGIAVSSFAWALPQTLKMNLSTLAAWVDVEKRLLPHLQKALVRVDEDNKPVPLTRSDIDATFQWLVSSFGLDQALVEKPSFVLKVFQTRKAKKPPEALFLNSFFLTDLAEAAGKVREKTTPFALARYLGIEAPADRQDLTANREQLEDIVAPVRTPLAKWPAPGGHPLVLLQQAAVNAAQRELEDKPGIVGVNGPPGTGKTTLLRDIIAGRVFERALAMTAFDDPNDAFSPAGDRGEFYQIYTLHPSLKGHEIIVASANNKAVENISKELPGIDAIGAKPSDLNYFKSISDELSRRSRSEDGDEDDQEKNAAETFRETWGLIAAVMGNAANRRKFASKFWSDRDWGLRQYLRAVEGQKLSLPDEHPQTGAAIGKRAPKIVQAENPPSPAMARKNWQATRARFLALRDEVVDDLARLEVLRAECRRVVSLREAVDIHCADHNRKAEEMAASEEKRIQAISALNKTQTSLGNAIRQREARIELKPGFLSRLFGTRSWRDWARDYRALLEKEDAIRATLEDANELVESSTAKLAELAGRVEAASQALNAARTTLEAAEAAIAAATEKGAHIVDDAFFDRPHADRHLSPPWLSPDVQAKRAQLFIEALAVHRAFIDVASPKLRNNLGAYFDDADAIARDPEQKDYLIDLWASLFLVVPVISTTFASVNRMFGQLPPEALGWLLVDEAGQATPQSAVGAIMRSKRAVIVGDPLQIEPVVTIPAKLVLDLESYFRLTPRRWTAPNASAQSLADRTSRFIGSFNSDKGLRHVGVPLLVHRRCADPMFSISNAIAYDGQMVFAAPNRNDNAVRACLGMSKWIDVHGQGTSKWVKTEGDALISALSKLATAGVHAPDIFIISPFKVVAAELKRLIASRPDLIAKLGGDARKWANERIGTVHTFQGREADTVFIVLGAANDDQGGARNWATKTPNILNVAVSRAKANVYVIGSKTAWAGMGHAQELGALLA